jgi:hypothetical protein
MTTHSLLLGDPAVTKQFLHDHAGLIERIMKARRSIARERFRLGNELAALARITFGYSAASSDTSIVRTIVRRYILAWEQPYRW